MTDHLVDDVWLRDVVGGLVVPDVLRAAEHLEGEGVEGFSLAEDAVDRLEGEPGFGLEVVADLLELGDPLRE